MEAVVKVVKWNGKQITKPGWYSGMPLEVYHSKDICSGPAVSSSNLRTCWAKSPAHMFSQWCENPKAEPRSPTSAMLLGAVAHHLILGEEAFSSKYVAQPETYRDPKTAVEKPWNNNARICQAWNEKQIAAGRAIAKVSMLEAVVKMSASLALQPPVVGGLLKGYVETSGFAQDRETGLWLKVRPDVIPTLQGDFADLKTTTDVTSHALQYTIRAYGYHQQGALIAEVVDQLGAGVPFQGFLLIFVETSPPYCARTVPLTGPNLELGGKMNRAMLRDIATCILNDHWPGPGEDDLRELPIANDEVARTEERLKRWGLA